MHAGLVVAIVSEGDGLSVVVSVLASSLGSAPTENACAKRYHGDEFKESRYACRPSC